MEFDETDIFISKTKSSGGSLNITIPSDTCDFCEVNEGDLVKIRILKVKKSSKKK